ncbi:hypothetical protein C8R45DRAFT_424775 [Mycena sanguinolenta]|nr:hypothetical protein C8R45DRAFT_424775 [Mycena sanguinolenta]
MRSGRTVGLVTARISTVQRAQCPQLKTTHNPNPMSLLRIPPEVRGIIFNLCFPPPQTYVQIIPYGISLPACRLNLPLALYRVCKLITSELTPLPVKLRRLDFIYINRGPPLLPGWCRSMATNMMTTTTILRSSCALQSASASSSLVQFARMAARWYPPGVFLILGLNVH